MMIVARRTALLCIVCIARAVTIPHIWPQAFTTVRTHSGTMAGAFEILNVGVTVFIRFVLKIQFYVSFRFQYHS